MQSFPSMVEFCSIKSLCPSCLCGKITLMNDIVFQQTATLAPDIVKGAGVLMEKVWPGYAVLFEGEIAAFQSASDVFQPFFVTAFSGKKIVGFGMLAASMMSDDLNAMSWVAVDPAFRGKKIGSYLVQDCINEATQRRKTIILTTTVPDFYAPHRFRLVEGFKNNENVLMIRDLSA